MVHQMLPSRSRCLMVIVAAFLIGRSVAAQERVAAEDVAPAQSDHNHNAAVPDRTGQLSRGQYSSRHQATLDMWRQRELSRDEVQRAARHPDPEVAGRANWILRQWRRGALPGMPPEITRRLGHGDDRTAIAQLLEAGQFKAAVVAAEESIGTVDRELIASRAAAAITRRFPIYIKIAVENDSLPALLRLIDLTADSKELAVCRVELMQHLGLEVDDTNLLPSSADSWTQLERQQAIVLIQCVLGQIDKALEIADNSGDLRLLGITEMLAGHWQSMARESEMLAESAEEGSYEQARYWSQTLIAADRGALTELFDRAIERLRTMDSTDNQLSIELRWKSLVGHGEIDAGLELLEKSRPDAAAVVALAASRGQQAFEILGLPLDQIDRDRNLETWIDDALATQIDQDRPTAEVRSALAMIRCLLNVGRHDVAWTIVTRMSNSDAKVDGVPIREYVLATLTMTQREDWVLRIVQQSGEEAFSSITQNTLAGTTDGDRAAFAMLMDSVGALKPKLEFADRVRIVYRLLSGQPAKGFDSTRDFDQLFELLATGRREIQQQRGMAVLTPRIRLSLPVAQMFAANGRADLAMRCLQYLVASRDSEATLESAERHLSSGRAESAADLLDLVWTQVQGDGSLSRLRGAQENADLAAKALVGQWTIARRSGDQPRAEQLLQQLKLTFCSPSTDTRSSLATYLSDRGEVQLALQIYRSLLPMTAFGSPGAETLYRVAWRHSRLARDTDIEGAARWYDLAASGTLESTDYYRSDYYVNLPVDVRRWSLEAAIERRDHAAAKVHLDRIFALDPLDIDSAERLLPLMRDSGMSQLADQALDRILGRGLDHIRRFPLDATVCNNLAWVAAMNHKRLDDALRLSQRAVDLEPDSAIFRDTLAEVLFQLGRKQEALQIEEHCILDDPGQWHLHQQVDKYRKALQ